MGIYFESIAGPRFKVIMTLFLVAGSAMFLFTGLNDSALWDDEATTALFGLSVWKTGDAHAMLDGNLIAYDDGKELWNLRNRFMPPLPFYVTAPFVGAFGRTSWAARFPFALMGFSAVILFTAWLWSAKENRLTWILFTAGILFNVSFFLYSRQCRWYAPALLFTGCVVFAYLRQPKTRFSMLFAALASAGLLATNYMSYIALYGCLSLDYALWERKSRRLRAADWVALFLPQAVLGVLLFVFWTPYPLIHEIFSPSPVPDRLGPLSLLWMFLREYNSCEFGALILILVAPVAGLFRKNPWLARGFCLWLTYVLIIAMIAPRSEAAASGLAPVRYLFPLIPLGIFLTVRGILSITGKAIAVALVIGFVSFGTNIFHLGPFTGLDSPEPFRRVFPHHSIRLTSLNFIRELVYPPRRTYAGVSEWIHENVAFGQTLWVVPNHALYPLMYHAPHALYAWQLSRPRTPQFHDLDAIHFIKQQWPEHVIVFGPDIHWIGPWLMGKGYLPVETLDMFFYDLVRPELFAHAFRPLTSDISDDQRVFIFRFASRTDSQTP